MGISIAKPTKKDKELIILIIAIFFAIAFSNFVAWSLRILIEKDSWAIPISNLLMAIICIFIISYYHYKK